MEVTNSLDTEIWRNFVKCHPNGNIFHTPEMFTVFNATRGHQSVLWAVTEKNKILALLPATNIRLLAAPFHRFTSRAVAYGSVLAEPGPAGQTALQILLNTYISAGQNAALFTELRHQYDVTTLQPVFNRNGFVFEEHENYLIDLTRPVEQIWQNISKSARKKMKQAKKKHALTITEINQKQELGDWYRLLQSTYSRAHVPLADLSLFEATMDQLHPTGMVQFLLGRVDSTPVAASVALLYKNTIYGWYRGFDRNYSHYLPNDLMVWFLLEWGARNGYKVFDFGGAGKPTQAYGPRRFKAKFGGQLVNCGRSICVHHPFLLSISKLGYQLFRLFNKTQFQGEQ